MWNTYLLILVISEQS